MKTQTLRLVEPSLELKTEFLDFAREVKREGRSQQEMIDDALVDFAGYVRRRLEWSRGRRLPAGWVPSSEYWLCGDDGTVLGFGSLRHSLNSALERFGGHIGYYIRPTARQKGYGAAILQQMLEKARRLGLKRVLITCDDDNLASARIIEKNGGILRDTIQNAGHDVPTRRYWIDLKKE